MDYRVKLHKLFQTAIIMMQKKQNIKQCSAFPDRGQPSAPQQMLLINDVRFQRIKSCADLRFLYRERFSVNTVSVNAVG